MKLIQLLFIVLFIVLNPAYAADLNLDGINDTAGKFIDLNNDGFDDSVDRNITPSAGTNESILVAHNNNPHLYFGWYRTSQMTEPGWDLFQRAIDWATTGSVVSNVILFTYNGTIDYTSPNNDGMAVYDHLLAQGYSVELHSQMDAATLPPSYYSSFDIAIYINGYGYNAANIVASGIPFITTSAQHSDDISIGNGTSSLHQYRDTFEIINNTFGITTSPYSLGALQFTSPMWTDGITPNSNAVVLVVADPTVNPVLTIFPAQGVLATTTHFDLTLILEAQAVSIVNIATATLNGADITALVSGCFLSGTVISGGETLRCPRVSGAVLTTGENTFSITVNLSDGSTLNTSAVWTVLETTEP